MARTLFGTDGIRGLAGRHPMTPEVAMRLGMALVWQARQRAPRSGHVPRIVVGKDTRLSGYLFETALASGVCAMGGKVLLVGPLPTPAVAHLTVSMRADAGVVVSASHNPFEDNGIKVFGPDGFKLPDEAEEALESLMDSEALREHRPQGAGIGRAERLDDAPGRYVAFVKGTFPADLTLEGVRLVVDAAHGAAYRVAPLVFEELGAEVVALGNAPDGRNINDGVGALHPEHAAEVVRASGAHMGVALDGDADRLVVVDEHGDVVDGDAVMALLARQMLREGKLAKGTLVATVMSNLGLERAMREAGGRLVRCQVGDRYVVETLRAGGYRFGGEASGHLVFLEHATTGDGLVAALQLLAVMCRCRAPLSSLASAAMERVPQLLRSERFDARKPLEHMEATQRAIEEAEAALGDSGRVLVRWSGTEPKLRVMVEGPQTEVVEHWVEHVLSAARRDLRAP